MTTTGLPEAEPLKVPLTHEVANKIADALGVSMSAYAVIITLNWRTKVFEAEVRAYLTDEQGELIAEAINEAKP